MKKKKIAIVSAVMIFMTAMGVIWWNAPVHFLSGVNVDDISHIEVFNGNTGNSFTVENKDDISYIVSNIQSIVMKKGEISLGYMGTMFNLTFYNTNEVAVENFIVNHYGTIRKDPFFYRDKTNSLCVDYLKSLEETSK